MNKEEEELNIVFILAVLQKYIHATFKDLMLVGNHVTKCIFCALGKFLFLKVLVQLSASCP